MKLLPCALTTQAVRTTAYHRDSGDALPEMVRLREENSDLVGWLSIEGVLDLPSRKGDYVCMLAAAAEKPDEAWIDVTHSVTRGSGAQSAEEIRQRMKREVGLTVSVGVSWNILSW